MTLDLPTGSMTFLFTDIEGSTQLWEQNFESMKAALARHDLLLRGAIEAHNGLIFKTGGDAFCAAFASAPDALTAALAAQRALYAEDWGKTPIKVRMALHTGAAEARDGDYFGPPLNRVARLLATAHGGQTLLSAVTDELVRASLPAGVELRDLGEWRLKDLTRLEHIYQLLVPDLPAEFPPLKALESFRTNLPVQLTSFVGREKEMAAIKTLITANRLTTLTGPGGTGKTRISLRVASDLLDSFVNGVWFVELAPLADPTLLTQTVMTTLGLREEIGRPLLDTLTDYLRAKITLIILDNCEHLVEAAAQLSQTLLLACPDVRLLVSSREALGVPGETAYRVPSLSTPNARLPQSAETVAQCEAARLFIDRAQTALPGFEMTEENAPAIAQVCSRLDGIPLALELAAARVKLLKVEQIAERLDDCFRLLTGGSRTALPRQQTLRALIDWSYDLLSEPERTLLRRLSVFAGGWTLEAIEAVCQGSDDYDIFDLLSQLANKSLLVVDTENETETRYRMLETIRQYAREKLAGTDEGGDIRNRHLEYFLGLAERAEPELGGPQVAEWLERLEVELDNFRTALEWSLKQDAQVGLRLASALMNYWQAHNRMHEGIDWLVQLLGRPAAAVRNAPRAKALTALASLHEAQIESLKAEPFAREGLEIYRELDDQRGVALALLVLGNSLCGHDDYAAGRPLVFESLALYRKLGDKAGIAEVLNMLGNFIDEQDPARARTYLEESLALARELGDTAGVADRLASLGRIAYRAGDFTMARPWLTESLEIHRSLGIADVSFVIEALGELGLREGNYEEARAYLEESVSLARATGRINANYWILSFLGYVALRQGDHVHARASFIEAQKGFKQAGLKIGVVYTMEGLACMAVAQGRPEQAARLFAWADATREVVDNARPPIEQADVDRELAGIHSQLDETSFKAACAAGRALNMDDAVALALQATGAA